MRDLGVKRRIVAVFFPTERKLPLLGSLCVRVRVTQNVFKCPPNHMTFAPAKFEIATSNSLEDDAFTRKYTI